VGRRENPVKKFFRQTWVGLKWVVLALICVEIFCFLLITATNLVLYGTPWESLRAHYDPYALFLNVEGVQPTLHNPPEPDSPAARNSLKRVWLFGGSTMRGGWVKPGETIPSYLAALVISSW